MTLILGAWLVTDATGPPTPNGGVRVIGDRIVDLGPHDELRQRHPDDDILEASHSVIAPGFVDAHTHLYGTLAHGIPVDHAPTDFWGFLNEFWWPLVEDRLDHEMIQAATEWVAAELLASGVTTFYDILEAPRALPDALFAQKEVLDRIGIRAVLSFEATERSGPEAGRRGIEENIAFINATSRDEGVISGLMSIHATFTCSPGFIKDAFDAAHDLGVLCHAHVNEGSHEGEWCLAHHGVRTMEFYDRLGVATDRMLASQCVHLSARERQIIAERGVRCVHMPLSNAEVGGGIAPVPEQVAAGVTMGLGSDGYITDPFEIMRGAFLIHKARLQDPQAMPAQQVFELATRGGAAALDLDHVGTLGVGWSADLQLINADLATPLTSDNLLDQLVLWRNRNDVTDVMVGGNWRVRNDEVLGVDLEQLRARVAEQANRLWSD